jgi:hypothetical protein
MRSAKLGCHRFPENDCAGLAQGPDGRVVTLGEIPGQRCAIHLGRHIFGFEQILDPDRHAINCRQWLADRPTRGTRICGSAGSVFIQMSNGICDWFALANRCKASLQIGTWSI